MFIMQPDASRKRRFAYRRSHTLAILPTDLIQEVDGEQDDEYSQLLKKTQDSPTHSLESSSEMERSDGDEDVRLTDGGATGGGSATSTPTRPSIKTRRAHFQQRRSISMIAEQPLLSEHDIHPPKPKKFTRTPSTPAIFLSKVKERIREKVMQTTVEWPHAAAMVHERRQRANDALQASFSRREVGKEQIAMRDLTPSRERKARNRIRSDPISNELSPSRHDNVVRPRIKSDPNPIENATTVRDTEVSVVEDSFEKPPNYREVARAALRRRSISEDTYDRGPLIHRLGNDTLTPGTSTGTNGIVCSDEDLKAIVVDHQKRRSPCPTRVHSRTLSLDAEGLQQNGSKIDSQSSLDSSTSSLSQKSNILLVEGTEREAKSMKNTRTTTQVDIYVYPEVVLDLKSKETILSPLLKADHNEQDGDDDEEYDDDDEDSSTKVRECIFDENGQTWDVYGADFDPEILGDAIQCHLGRMMKRKSEEIQVQKLNQPPLVRKRSGSASDCQRRAENKAGESMSFILRLLCAFAGRRQEMNST